MIVVIQCAARKRHNAGHLRTPDGRPIMFVADPATAPVGDGFTYARPDDPSHADGKSWRDVLKAYNSHSGQNPQGLLPAWQLYSNRTYEFMAKHESLGLDRLFILSAGWGLISASFLTPKYDITFSRTKNVQLFKRRRRRDSYRDFCMLPSSGLDPIVFLGGKDYIRLFCDLTANAGRDRTVFYAGRKPTAPGCTLCSFGKPYTNWHYQCAKALLEGRTPLRNI